MSDERRDEFLPPQPPAGSGPPGGTPPSWEPPGNPPPPSGAPPAPTPPPVPDAPTRVGAPGDAPFSLDKDPPPPSPGGPPTWGGDQTFGPGSPTPPGAGQYGAGQYGAGPGSPPPGGWAQGYGPPQGNGVAIAAFVCGLIGLVLAAVGLLTILPLFISIPCSIVAWALGPKGRKKVDRGETTQHRGLAQAGFITGIIGTVIGILGLVGWILAIIFVDELRDDFERGFEQNRSNVIGPLHDVVLGVRTLIGR